MRRSGRSLDNIVGILHTKELVRWFVGDGSRATLSDLIRTVPSVHESVTADRVLREHTANSAEILEAA